MTNMDEDLLRAINRLADEEHAREKTSGGPSQATSADVVEHYHQ